MSATRVEIDATLVGRLLAAQFPQWADLPLELVESAGTDNAIFRLGADMAVRLPRVSRATGQVDKEHRWLPQLAPRLPLDIPVPLGKGVPGEGYPWPWSVHSWLDGENSTVEPIADPHDAATRLVDFVVGSSGLTPLAVRQAVRTTSSVACRWPCGTPSPAPRSWTCKACSRPRQ